MSYDVKMVNAEGKKATIRWCDKPRGALAPPQLGVGYEEEVEFDMSITYNYSKFYDQVWPKDGIRSLNGMSVPEAMVQLELGVLSLGTNYEPDYWKATRGNAGRALSDLLTVCRRINNPEDYHMEVW